MSIKIDCPDCGGSDKKCTAQGICGYPNQSEICTPDKQCGEYLETFCTNCKDGKITLYTEAEMQEKLLALKYRLLDCFTVEEIREAIRQRGKN